MASETGIVNVALRELGAKRITKLTDGSTNANIMVDIYAETRDELLRDANWNFATSRAKLAKISTAPAFGFDNAYQLPTDWIRTVSAHDNEDGTGSVAYKIEGRTVLSDADDLYLRYVRQEVDPNTMTPAFRTALSLRLARRAAIAIAQSNTLEDRKAAAALIQDRKAKAADAIEDDPEPIPAGSWVTERNR